MKFLILSLLCASVVCAQDAAAPPPEVPPDRVVAEVSGHPVTAGELKRILANAPENIYQVINENPADFLERYTMLSQLTGDAFKAGLDQKSPYKERLEWQRSTVLMMALLEEKTKKSPVSDADIEAAYKADLMRFRVAEVLPIVFPYDNSAGVLRDENTARKRAQEVWQELRNGAPFRETMLKASDPRAAEKYKSEHPTILPNSKLPPNVIKTVFSTLPGQYTEPLQFGNAFYILQTLTLGAAPLSEVRELIASEIRQKRVDAEMKQLRDSAKAEVKHPVYFQLQDPTAPPGREIPADLRPETVVAVVNGRNYTSAEMTHVLNGAPPTVRQAASRQPREFLIQLALMNHLADEAQKSKLSERAPASDRIRWTDMQTLMQAQIDETMKAISNTAEEQEKYFRDNAKRYQQARVKMIYISTAWSRRRPVRRNARAMTARPRPVPKRCSPKPRRGRTSRCSCRSIATIPARRRTTATSCPFSPPTRASPRTSRRASSPRPPGR